MIRTSLRRLAEFWCKTVHPSPMWPINGHYRCRTCLREYPVAWELDSKRTDAPQTHARLPFAPAPLPGGTIAQPAAVTR